MKASRRSWPSASPRFGALMATLAPKVPVAAVGAGTMGAGIAQVAAAAGHRVLLFDAEQTALTHAEERIAGALARAVDQGRLAPEERDRTLGRITRCDSFDALTPAGFVIEAIAEDPPRRCACSRPSRWSVERGDLRQQHLVTVDHGARRRAEAARAAGRHAFLQSGSGDGAGRGGARLASAPEVVETVRATAQAWGKTAVVCRSTPGFIVNRIARLFYGEALRALAEGAADVATSTPRCALRADSAWARSS